MKKANIIAERKHVLIISLKFFVTLYHMETMVMFAGLQKIQGELGEPTRGTNVSIYFFKKFKENFHLFLQKIQGELPFISSKNSRRTSIYFFKKFKEIFHLFLQKIRNQRFHLVTNSRRKRLGLNVNVFPCISN